jgi:hypothetical protein
MSFKRFELDDEFDLAAEFKQASAAAKRPFFDEDEFDLTAELAKAAAEAQLAAARTTADQLRLVKEKCLELSNDELMGDDDRLIIARHYGHGLGIAIRDAELSRYLAEAELSLHPLPSPRIKGERMDATPTPWAWEGLVMAGTSNLLVAPPKVGKSALMIGMIGAWWKGESSYLGHSFHGACPAVFIVGTDQPESDWLTLLRREGLVDAQDTLREPIEALWHTGAPLFLNAKGIALLAAHAANYPGALFLLDSYHACISPLGIDEAASDLDGPIRALNTALAPHKATLVVIHHTNKGVTGGNATSASRGSNSLPAAFSLTLLMNWLKQPAEGQTQSDYRVLLKTQGRAKGSAVLIELQDQGWISHGDGATAMQAEKLSEAADELQGRQADAFDYIAERWELGHFPVSGLELAAQLNLPGNKTNRCLQGLLRKGLIKQVGETEPSPQGGRPSNLYAPSVYTPKHPSLPPERVNSVPKVNNPSPVHARVKKEEGYSPFSSYSPISGGGTSPSWYTPDGGKSPQVGPPAGPPVGLAVERLVSGEWRHGWVIHDGSNPHAVTIARIGEPHYRIQNLRWELDLRPAPDSPFAQPLPLPRLGQPVEKLQAGTWQNGWVLHDVSNPLELIIERLDNPLVQFRAQRWGIDIRPCTASPSDGLKDGKPQPEPDWI